MNGTDLQTINRTIKELSNEDWLIAAVPGVINNKGQKQEILNVLVVHKPTNKDIRWVFREDVRLFRDRVKEAIDHLSKPQIITDPNGLKGLF